MGVPGGEIAEGGREECAGFRQPSGPAPIEIAKKRQRSRHSSRLMFKGSCDLSPGCCWFQRFHDVRLGGLAEIHGL